MFTQHEILAIVADDNFPSNLELSYSENVLPIVEENWNELSTDFELSENLISNVIRFRMAKNAPDGILDYSPNHLGEHDMLINFIESIQISSNYKMLRQISNPPHSPGQTDCSNELKFGKHAPMG